MRSLQEISKNLSGNLNRKFLLVSKCWVTANRYPCRNILTLSSWYLSQMLGPKHQFNSCRNCHGHTSFFGYFRLSALLNSFWQRHGNFDSFGRNAVVDTTTSGLWSRFSVAIFWSWSLTLFLGSRELHHVQTQRIYHKGYRIMTAAGTSKPMLRRRSKIGALTSMTYPSTGWTFALRAFFYLDMLHILSFDHHFRLHPPPHLIPLPV